MSDLAHLMKESAFPPTEFGKGAYIKSSSCCRKVFRFRACLKSIRMQFQQNGAV